MRAFGATSRKSPSDPIHEREPSCPERSSAPCSPASRCSSPSPLRGCCRDLVRDDHRRNPDFEGCLDQPRLRLRLAAAVRNFGARLAVRFVQRRRRWNHHHRRGRRELRPRALPRPAPRRRPRRHGGEPETALSQELIPRLPGTSATLVTAPASRRRCRDRGRRACPGAAAASAAANASSVAAARRGLRGRP